MIKLFNIPHYTISTSDYNHCLHGTIVTNFENRFAKYVGAKYACGANSATSIIFLALQGKFCKITVPSMIPPVVCNAIITSGNKLEFKDDTKWIGDSYVLHDFGKYKIIDSAQKVIKNQFILEANNNDLMFFSFYPTKPIGSVDGGMVVSNDFDKIQWFREAVFNGMGFSKDSWKRIPKFPGWKMYLNSIQADIANKNMDLLENNKEKLYLLRNLYNKAFSLNNTSEHLYRIIVSNNKICVDRLKKKGLQCGIHYSALNTNKIYNSKITCPNSEKEQYTTISIPFHVNIGVEESTYIIQSVRETQNAV